MKTPILIFTALAFLALNACVSAGSDARQRGSEREAQAGGAPTNQSDFAHQAELDAGVEWLLKHQNEDGSFGSHAPQRPYDITLGSLGSLKAFHNASTALAAMALIDLEQKSSTDQSAHRAFAWLIKAPEARRATMSIFYNTWAQLYSIQAFARGLQDERLASLHSGMKKRCRREIEILYGIQSAEGGWGYYDFGWRTLAPSGKLSTSFTTAAVLAALYEAEQAGIEVDQHRIDNALDCVERQRGAEGAFVYSHAHIFRAYGEANRVEGSLCRSQACNYALHLWGRVKGTAEAKRGLSNLFQHHDFVEIARQRQFPHETWFKNAPYYYYFGHFYAAELLKCLSVDEAATAASTLGALIAETQDNDGSFWDYPLYGYTKAYGTAYGVLILNQCRKFSAPAADTESLLASAWYKPSSQEGEKKEKAGAKGFQLASPEWRHQEALERATKYLLEHQHENGQFGSPESRRVRRIYLGGSNSLHAFGQGTHSLAMRGLLSLPPSPEIDAALRKGLTYLLNAPRTGRVNERTFYNTWAHCYNLEALADAYKDSRFTDKEKLLMRNRAQQELTSLLVVQGADGGFGYFDSKHRLGHPSGQGSTPFNTAIALDAFEAAKSLGLEVPEKRVRAAVITLEDMRLPNGAYLYSRTHYYYPWSRANKIEGSLGRSQACNISLFNQGKLKAPALKKSLDDLFQHHDYIEIARQRQLPHETWFANAPYYYYFGHFGAAKCIEKLDAKDQPAYSASLADFVAATQDEDGCFWDMPLYDFGKAYGTGYALSILTRCKAMIPNAGKASVASVE